MASMQHRVPSPEPAPGAAPNVYGPGPASPSLVGAFARAMLDGARRTRRGPAA